ncbi:hypothetical protein C6497_02130 [Candidatus Poribacteria bacterium]|nr:MAG: hypothetical protein C6497_02130 [Candidatus Poribacteria bacterium]
MSSIEQLANIITDSTQPITSRRAAVIQLAEMSSVEALSILSQALSDTAPGVRREAATALLNYNDNEVSEILTNSLRIEENDLTLWTIIEILGVKGTEIAIPYLKDLLDSSISPLTRRELQKSIQLIENRIPTAKTPDERNIKIDEDRKSSKHDLPQQSIINKENIESESDDEVDNVEELITEQLDNPEENNTAKDFDSDIIQFEGEDTSIDKDQDSIIDISIENDLQKEGPNTEETGTSPHPKDSDVTTDFIYESQQNSNNEKENNSRDTTSPALPVLVPNTSVVIYEQQDQIYQPNIFDLVLRPNEYLSKRWVSRTRLYLVVFCLLIASTIALVYSQVQRQPHSPYSSPSKFAFITDPKPYFEDGSLFLQQGDFRRAIDTYELIRYTDNLDQSVYPILYRNLGYAYYQENRYGAAIEAYEDYLKTSKFNTQTPFSTEYAYASSIDSSLENDTSDYMTYIYLGKAYNNLGSINDARLTFEKAIKIAPNEAEAYSNLALVYSKDYQQQNLLAEALGYAAIKLNPNIAAYQDTLGSILVQNGRLNKATDLLEYAVRLQSDYYPSHYHLSMLARESKDPNQTLDILKRNLIRNTQQSDQSRSAMLGLLTYIYENKVKEMNRFIPSLYRLRGIKKRY